MQNVSHGAMNYKEQEIQNEQGVSIDIIQKEKQHYNSSSIFTPDRLSALKHQIMAFKLLSKNTPLPPNLQQAVLTPLNNNSITKHINNPSSSASKDAYVSPLSLLVKPISCYAHSSRHHKILVPSILPIGVDPKELISQREQRLLVRLQGYQKRGNTIKDTIQFKSIKLHGVQKRLRNELVSGVIKSTVLALSMDRVSYRRMKKVSLRDARQVEYIDRQQYQSRHQMLQEMKQNRLYAICEHGSQLITHGKLKESKAIKLGRAVLQYHQHIEKEEQRQIERVSKERILALKNDDEEAYMKLIDKAKDTRLTQLLKQTGQFLESLTKSVIDQQNENKRMIAYKARNDIEYDIDTEDNASTEDYFQISHKVYEEVYQPSTLVGGRLNDYQIKGLQWMVSLFNNNLNGILADEMGLGKTIQTIGLITYLVEVKKQTGHFLIIVPLSTLTNWTLEFEKWAPSIEKIVYKGTPPVRRELANCIKAGKFQVLLTTFEYIIRDRYILSKVKWLYLIIDEGHRMKNSNSKLTVCLRQHYRTQYRLILTGTPLQNNLPELWALLNFILPKIFKSVKTFEEWFNTPFSHQGVQDKVHLNEEEQLLIIKRLHKVLRPFLLRRLKSDVEAELPDKIEHIIKCKMSVLQAKLYQQIKKHNALFFSNNYTDNTKGSIQVKGLNNTVMQLRKVCNHPFVFEEVENALNPSGKSNELLYRTCGKFELLDRMLPKLKKTGHRVLMFFQMTFIMSIMEDYLNWRNYSYLRLDGSTKAEDRSTLLHDFNEPNSPYFIFLLSTRAGGLGLNLQTADTVILFDSDWNPHQDLQAQDRAHRIGQTKEVRIYRLVTSNSIEELILARAQYKLDIDGKVIQAGKFDNRSTEEDREAFLRSLLEDKMDESEDKINEEIDDEELNEILKRSDKELAIFKKIDKERVKTEAQMYKRRGISKPLDRLIQENELPEEFLQENNVLIERETLVGFGRGHRARDDVLYDDGLSDEEWLNAIENGKNSLQELQSNRAKKRGRTTDINDEQDINVYSSNKKSGFNKKMHEIDRKRGKSKQISPLIRQQLTQIFQTCYQAIENAVEEDKTTYRQRCELFMDLVSKKEYPYYYTLIKNPISMNMIKERIHTDYYSNILEFENDFHLMFENARIFNEEGSTVYKDADEMQKIFDKELEKHCPNGVLPNVYQQQNLSSIYLSNTTTRSKISRAKMNKIQ
ncbi:SNF2 family N-terminal domain-containing protein [Cokeromyces recurvatus]|uniref:SNF2 family N-terminal domain-containing protein n=1 Tax=Cokeromyces recurvatus TaxID=90255 RepID=UPI00221E981E|nr:SNF2 family N-terminal domain-containing protein [Cokeromyces recurvatus]KAI7907142.1 SNF2 family N-terminal domain-containing protein [Cokeromyces recurvatus]